MKYILLDERLAEVYSIINVYDDVDYYMIQRLTQMKHSVTTLKDDWPELKFFYKQKSTRTGLKWSWPFVDISFYTQNSTHVWHLNRPSVIMEISDFYPIQRRPLFCRSLPAPYNPRAFFKKVYDSFVCEKSTRSKVLQKPVPRCGRWTYCQSLLEYYPYVVRRKSDYGYITETLQVNFTNLYTISTNVSVRNFPLVPFTI